VNWCPHLELDVLGGQAILEEVSPPQPLLVHPAAARKRSPSGVTPPLYSCRFQGPILRRGKNTTTQVIQAVCVKQYGTSAAFSCCACHIMVSARFYTTLCPPLDSSPYALGFQSLCYRQTCTIRVLPLWVGTSHPFVAIQFQNAAVASEQEGDAVGSALLMTTPPFPAPPLYCMPHLRKCSKRKPGLCPRGWSELMES